eukprot:jgi/Mesvir1/24466/Mv21830-RA.1
MTFLRAREGDDGPAAKGEHGDGDPGARPMFPKRPRTLDRGMQEDGQGGWRGGDRRQEYGRERTVDSKRGARLDDRGAVNRDVDRGSDQRGHANRDVHPWVDQRRDFERGQEPDESGRDSDWGRDLERTREVSHGREFERGRDPAILRRMAAPTILCRRAGSGLTPDQVRRAEAEQLGKMRGRQYKALAQREATLKSAAQANKTVTRATSQPGFFQ